MKIFDGKFSENQGDDKPPIPTHWDGLRLADGNECPKEIFWPAGKVYLHINGTNLGTRKFDKELKTTAQK